MKKRILIVLLTVLSVININCKESISEEEKLKKTAEISKISARLYGGPLVDMLFMTMHDKGVKNAVEYCGGYATEYTKKTVPKIEQRMIQDFNIKSLDVRRTALKLRNPGNKPSETEEKVLLEWEEKYKKNEEINPAFFNDNGIYKGMLPIKMTSPDCLNCHGSEERRHKEAYAKIKELFPEDKAVDYELNDIRGAILVKIEF
ncbi:MAG: DUF3365 domain-containing protein [Spirochaetia bacterium]|nr:DUF3365 domain-containing protein [Spirochaetia bacterium]